MKLLLTSNGISNDMLAKELEKLAGKKFNELMIGFIPTAALVNPGVKDWMIKDIHRLKERGAKVDIIDIAQLPKEELFSRLEVCDVIFVGGGNTYYLSYWMDKSGLFEMLPDLLETKVYAGISAGSMVMGKTLRTSSYALDSERFYDDEYDEFGPKGRSAAKTFGAIEHGIRPHLNSRYFPEITEEKIQWIASEMNMSIYTLDDDSALSVVDGEITVVSEGEWKLIEPKKGSND